ncbi:MAG: hypothetical protein HW388_1347 [Dehalococcoidia bacterium]|nr:hypothetical protein [Dehalococcoidia bacterium]
MAREITLAEFPVFLREKAEQFFEVKRQALSVWDQLHSDYPNWRVPDDARLAFFGRMVNHCDAIGFLLLAAADCLGDPDWWSRRVRVGTANDITIFLEETERTGRRYGFCL